MPSSRGKNKVMDQAEGLCPFLLIKAYNSSISSTAANYSPAQRFTTTLGSCLDLENKNLSNNMDGGERMIDTFNQCIFESVPKTSAAGGRLSPVLEDDYQDEAQVDVPENKTLDL